MEAKKDGNRISTLLGTSNVDGETPIVIQADTTTHVLEVSDGSSGSDLSSDIASRDANRVPVLMGVSETDGETPVAIYADADGKLLIDSN